MNAKNLPLKFLLFVLLPVALCLWGLSTAGLNQGIDLAGGTSMDFEIRTRESQIQRLELEIQSLQERVAQADEEQAAALQKQLQAKQQQLEGLQAQGRELSNLAEEMIDILKERIDPEGLLNIEMRPVGQNRINVRIPAASEESRQYKREYLRQLERIEASNVQRSELRTLLEVPAERRAETIAEIAGGNETIARALEDFLASAQAAEAARKALEDARAAEKALPADAAADARQAAEKAVADALGASRQARLNLLDQQREVLELNLSRARLEGVLRSYLSPREAATIENRDVLESRQQTYQSSLEELKKDYPSRIPQIEAVVDAYKNWANTREGLDPEDFIRLARKAGVLEFRIAPVLRGNEEQSLTLDEAEIERYTRMLAEEGPEAALKNNEPFAWFPVHEEAEIDRFIISDYGGQTYVLLSNEPELTMLQREGAQGGVRWQLDSARPDYDQTGRPAVAFSLNETGARLFSRLTGSNIGRPMAILLDDEMYSAPNIRSTISSQGQISGNFTQAEVIDLVRTLRAGSLPARLNTDPISINDFGPALGQQNREMGMRAAYWGLIAVAVFMLVYYLLAGAIADIALLLNLILVLGAMSLLGAVFTLPGIAGIILTIGIAVDANVLIFERLREEQQKNSNIRVALRNAYERALSAIFDANITTLITCLILGWVGTTEVRGFAITLGLGILFSLFTALVVTRWVFQALLDLGLLKRPVPMLRIIRVPSVDWIGKRKIFWGLSLVFLIAGVGSLLWQGSDVLGIEFSSGTKATISFQPGTLIDGQAPDDAVVREKFDATAEQLGYEQLRHTAMVETVLNPDAAREFLRQYDADGDQAVSREEWRDSAGEDNDVYFDMLAAGAEGPLTAGQLRENLPPGTYQISTSETELKRVREVIEKAFGRQLISRVSCEYRVAAAAEELGVAISPDGVTQIDVEAIASADPAYRRTIEDFLGGAMMVVDNVNPGLTLEDYRERIADMRLQPDFARTVLSEIAVTGIGEPAADGIFKRFLVLVSPADPDAAATPQTRQNFFEAARTWAVQEPLERSEAYAISNFDAAIAAKATRLAVVAIILSCLAIVIYLWFRFGSVQWGLAAVICLVHDVLIVVGLVAATGWIYNTVVGRALTINSFKIDLAMVAAILTVIGYSVNDTIVVFDRIRENRGKLSTISASVINNSINQTLGRTLITSLTTLIVVVIMFVFGGTGIHGFSFALLMGVLFGTYSSIAVASPLLLGFKEAIVVKTAPKTDEAAV